MGFVSFDIWNKYLDVSHGITIENIKPGKSKTAKWTFRASGEFMFFTGIAYVNKVRYEDGTFWYHDPTIVIKELQKVQKDFDVNKLQDEKDED